MPTVCGSGFVPPPELVFCRKKLCKNFGRASTPAVIFCKNYTRVTYILRYIARPKASSQKRCIDFFNFYKKFIPGHSGKLEKN
jgi:hypothetical protein